jgi:hypothetical protein
MERERNTAADMDETRTDGDDDDEGGNFEDEHGEYEDGAGGAGDGTASHSNRRQAHSFYFTTGALKRMQSKEDGTLTATCQVGGHAQCINLIPMPNGGTQGVAHHFLNDAGAVANHSGRTESHCDEGGQVLDRCSQRKC